jgi:PPM family protein phosphatase
MIGLRAGAASLVGRVRSANEDALLVADDLVVVADGMGGHLAGEVASAEAVEIVGAVAGRRSLADLVSSVHLANRRINDRAADDDELRGMGTTVCAVGVVDEEGEHLAVLNVGDSRVYLFADGSLTRLTEDHSLVETLVREGRITPEDAEVHPQRNVLTRALGVEALVVVDAWLLEPCVGDRLLLCSDGLFNELTEDRIARILAEGEDPEVSARRLAAEADAAGGRDNISAVVVDVTGPDRPPEPLGSRYRRIATPAVDLDDLDRDPTNDTATVPMVPVASAPSPAADDAGADVDPADDVDDDADAGELGTDSDQSVADGAPGASDDRDPAADVDEDAPTGEASPTV